MAHVAVISNTFYLLFTLCVINIYIYINIYILKSTAHKNGTLNLLFIN